MFKVLTNILNNLLNQQVEMVETSIPTVDLSPFFREGEEDGKSKAIETICKACSDFGFFQIVNHGVPFDFMIKLMPPERCKSEHWSNLDAPLLAGYGRHLQHSPDKSEYVLMFPPQSGFNTYPEDPPEFKYFPATENENNVITPHEDGNCITFVFHDEVNVLSNNNFRSSTHRVVRPKGKSRYSFAFFHNLHGDKWVEPLPKFATDIGEVPRYRGFLYKDYQQLRLRNKTHPPSRPQDEVHITHYAINTNTSQLTKLLFSTDGSIFA
ncbi:hypothetical protein K2173_019731 [Erythroxylum novogranatense]|uniref:Non-haem dioxygenase N-terminal domain-containing protein n=1 Tax=Erythroxylum novogranatense TaxID=1862640 RepID=A0AAV8SM54_9ROSI|nr:hypothetical protein K2173_019731 [Erythroxylum novogranatense]